MCQLADEHYDLILGPIAVVLACPRAHEAAVAAMRSRGINPFHTSLGGTIMLNLLITFSIPGISIGGHVGGLVGGFVAGWILTDLGPSKLREPWIPAVLVGVIGVGLVGGCLAIA